MTLDQFLCSSGAVGDIFQIRSELDKAIPDWKIQARDSRNWGAIDNSTLNGLHRKILLDGGGSLLAQHWLFSSNLSFREDAEQWLCDQWKIFWPELSDQTKRRLAEILEERLSYNRGASSVLNDLLHAVRRFSR
ncbi:MAG: hypothetical protein Q4G66_09460 [bacterium]|nr:hypothetical protein [bacterium]